MTLKRHFLLMLRKSLASLSEVTMSSACSGCDIAFICASKLMQYWSHILEESVTLKHGFLCEKDASKQRFLLSQFDALMFGDIMDLQNDRAVEVRTHEVTSVPGCTLFTAGFSCKSRSPLNNKRASFKNCLQHGDNEAETTQTWQHTYAYIVAKKPPIIILENVTTLLEKDGGKGERSDGR